MELFNDIKNAIKDDVEQGLDVAIIEEDDTHITIYDGEGVYSREYTIYNPNIIDEQWIKDKIIVTPSANNFDLKIDINQVASWINASVDKPILLTLQNIVFIGDSEADFDYLDQYSEEFSNQLECSDLPNDGQIGIMWYEACKVFVHVGNIIESTQEMLDDGSLFSWEKNDCINTGVCETLLHELRHLAVANPYLSEDILQEHGLTNWRNEEQDAEEYAKTIFNAHPIYLMRQDEIEEDIEL